MLEVSYIFLVICNLAFFIIGGIVAWVGTRYYYKAKIALLNNRIAELEQGANIDALSQS